MFDNLREQANSTPFYEDEASFTEAESVPITPPRRSANGQFLGMTPRQRFLVAFMLLIAICALGSMLLLITGTISLT